MRYVMTMTQRVSKYYTTSGYDTEWLENKFKLFPTFEPPFYSSEFEGEEIEVKVCDNLNEEDLFAMLSEWDTAVWFDKVKKTNPYYLEDSYGDLDNYDYYLNNRYFGIKKVEDNVWNGMLDLGLNPLTYFTHSEEFNLWLNYDDYLKLSLNFSNKKSLFKEIVSKMEESHSECGDCPECNKENV
jgi:hypothetical protein